MSKDTHQVFFQDIQLQYEIPRWDQKFALVQGKETAEEVTDQILIHH